MVKSRCDTPTINHLQAQAASRATRVPPVKRVSQVGGCSYHHRNPVLVLSAVQVMGGDAIVCNHMQAQAASRATRVPPAKRVSQVGGHSYHDSVLGSCLGGVIRMHGCLRS